MGHPIDALIGVLVGAALICTLLGALIGAQIQKTNKL